MHSAQLTARGGVEEGLDRAESTLCLSGTGGGRKRWWRDDADSVHTRMKVSSLTRLPQPLISPKPLGGGVQWGCSQLTSDFVASGLTHAALLQVQLQPQKPSPRPALPRLPVLTDLSRLEGDLKCINLVYVMRPSCALRLSAAHSARQREGESWGKMNSNKKGYSVQFFFCQL